MKDIKDYDAFVEEVSRIINNYKETSQFKAKHKVWQAKNGEPEPEGFYAAPARPRTQSSGRLDVDGDTIMTPARTTQTAGARADQSSTRWKKPGTGGGDKLTPRAKWVTKAELNARKEKNLCFRCGGSGHRVDSCPYRAAINPAKTIGVNVATFLPVLEDAGTELEESDIEGAGKA
jgi:hypothetical protein